MLAPPHVIINGKPIEAVPTPRPRKADSRRGYEQKEKDAVLTPCLLSILGLLALAALIVGMILILKGDQNSPEVKHDGQVSDSVAQLNRFGPEIIQSFPIQEQSIQLRQQDWVSQDEADEYIKGQEPSEEITQSESKISEVNTPIQTQIMPQTYVLIEPISVPPIVYIPLSSPPPNPPSQQIKSIQPGVSQIQSMPTLKPETIEKSMENPEVQQMQKIPQVIKETTIEEQFIPQKIQDNPDAGIFEDQDNSLESSLGSLEAQKQSNEYLPINEANQIAPSKQPIVVTPIPAETEVEPEAQSEIGWTFPIAVEPQAVLEASV